LIRAVNKTIEEHQLLVQGDYVIVGLSGGADSMCLLTCLLMLRERYDLKIEAVHIHHGLRGESADRDTTFVQDYCERLNVPITVVYKDVKSFANVHHYSIEEAGRVVRYRIFEEIRYERGAQKIAVAHHQNDLIESYLINMIRGAGLDGLASIAYFREPGIIRPLLDVSREAIESFLKSKAIPYCTDETNAENDYERNRIRNIVLPQLKTMFNPGIEQTLARSAMLFKDEQAFWHRHNVSLFERIASIEGKDIVVQKNKFDVLTTAEKRHFMRAIIKKKRGHTKNISFDLIEQMIYLNKTGTFVAIDDTLSWHLTYETYVLKTLEKQALPPRITSQIVTRDAFHQMILEKYQIAVDADMIKGKLYLRHRQDGDRFSPLGLMGSKKLKKFFIDAKIPQFERDAIWLLCDDEKIVWIVGYRMSELCKVKKNTESVMIIGFEAVV